MDFVDEYNTVVSGLILMRGLPLIICPAPLQVIQGKLAKYFELSNKLGGDVAKHVCVLSSFHSILLMPNSVPFQAGIVKSAFQVQVSFITSAGCHKAPPLVSLVYQPVCILVTMVTCMFRQFNKKL